MRFFQFAATAGLATALALTCTVAAGAASKEGGGAFAPAPSTKAEPAPARKQRTVVPSRQQAISGCVVVSASVNSTKSNGKPWDVDGNRVAPDLFMVDLSNRKQGKTCKDSFNCTWTLNGKSGSISIAIYDRDVMAHDKIGSGKCSLSSSSCQLGLATIKLRGC